MQATGPAEAAATAGEAEAGSPLSAAKAAVARGAAARGGQGAVGEETADKVKTEGKASKVPAALKRVSTLGKVAAKLAAAKAPPPAMPSPTPAVEESPPPKYSGPLEMELELRGVGLKAKDMSLRGATSDPYYIIVGEVTRT